MNASVSLEISEYLNHGDQHLALRRLLDYCLETHQHTLIREAITLSQKYRAFHEVGEPDQAKELLISQSFPLLQKIDAALSGPAHQKAELVVCDQITKKYAQGNFSLLPVSLALASGEILGVVGENGNGKTTLLRCLSGQLAVDGGVVRFPQLSEADAYTVRGYVAFIPQRIPKWYGLLKDNLHFSASLSGLKGAENELMVDFMIERLGLGPYAHLNWDRISSGYRTRFELARILLFKPGLLILDEPLANLDINAQQTVLTDLRFLAKSAYHSLGVILSSQQLHEVEKVADRVLFIKNGACQMHGLQEQTSTETVLEIESAAEREVLSSVLDSLEVKIQFNGGYYTLFCGQNTSELILKQLINSNIPLKYYRDISHSTKRFFNN
jgi:ABC-2 type transport system ATP-binding protein